MAEDAAGAVRRTPRPDVVDQAVRELARHSELIAVLVKACKCCVSGGYSPGGGAPYPSECAWCDHEPDRHGEPEIAKLRGPVTAALGDAGLLADPEQKTDGVVRDRLRRARVEREQLGSVRAERDEAVALCANLQSTLLNRLAELAEASGKARSAEWLRACASLPMSEWPPAPAYKGPMVPAAELEEAQARVTQLEEQVAAGHRVQLVVAGQWLGHAADKLGDGPDPEYLQRLADWLTDGTPGDEPEPVAERDGLQARIEELKRSYELKVQDFARETARVSAGLRACTVTPTNKNVPRHIVGEALLGWIGAQEHIGDTIRNGALRAALQGDQPAERPPTTVDVFGHDGRFLYAGQVQPRPGGGWNVFAPGDQRRTAEPPVTPPDPSGRIVDGGPVQPFAEEDRP